MIAYDSSGLDNREARRQAKQAEEENLISAEEHANIRAAFPDPFYSPHFFPRLGFFVLTLVCLSFCSGFFALLTAMGGASGFIFEALVMAVACFAALEWFIRKKNNLGAGVDDALLYTGFGIAVGVLFLIDSDMPPALVSFICLMMATACVLRYADRLMTVIAFAALLCVIFFTSLKAGPVGRALLSFLLMGACALLFFVVQRAGHNKKFRHYFPVFEWLKTAALLCFYAAGNYFVVREANHQLSADPAGPSADIPLAWFFWIITISIPLVYIAAGLKKKDRVFLVSGMVLLAAAVFTFRYYHSLLAPEWALVLGGVLLLTIAIAGLRLLVRPRAGLTAGRTGKDPLEGLRQLEALIIDETLSAPAPAPSGVVFGGGSGGGGGAGGSF